MLPKALLSQESLPLYHHARTAAYRNLIQIWIAPPLVVKLITSRAVQRKRSNPETFLDEEVCRTSIPLQHLLLQSPIFVLWGGIAVLEVHVPTALALYHRMVGCMPAFNDRYLLTISYRCNPSQFPSAQAYISPDSLECQRPSTYPQRNSIANKHAGWCRKGAAIAAIGSGCCKRQTL